MLVIVAEPAQPGTVALIVYTPAFPAASEFTLASVKDVGFVIAVPPGLVQEYAIGPEPAMVVVAVRAILLPTQPGVGDSVTPENAGNWFTVIAAVLVILAVPTHPATVALIVYTPALPVINGFTLAVVSDVGFVMAVPPGLVQLYVIGPVPAIVVVAANVILPPAHPGFGLWVTVENDGN